MKYSACALLASAGWASALTQQCTGESVNENNNWFCGAVNHILYENFNSKGSFKTVTSMSDSGDCGTADKAYNGPLAPLDEDLSIHVRGPFQLKEAAVYNLGSGKKKRSSAPSPHVHEARHGHGHGHRHLHKEKRADMVVATINGQVVSWENNYFGPSTDAPAAPAATTAAAPPADPATTSKPDTSDSSSDNSNSDSSSDSSSDSDSTDSVTTGSGGDWDRISYYNAEQGTADNIVFMGNYGGQGSGVWDTVWGGSLAYLNAEGNGGSATSQVLKDVEIPSNVEFAMFSGEKCDDSCGYSRVDDVAYKGFAGANKVFLFNFKMPLDGERGFNGDMPALWALNGRIPRTMQYGDCSCWTSGCGEADFYEVLASGDTKCKSTFHLNNSGGSSDYFDRPVDNYVKVAVVFDESSASVSIKELDSSVDFSEGLDEATVKSWIKGGSGTSSLFQVT